MTKWPVRCTLAILLALTVSACADKENAPVSKTREAIAAQVNPRHSGYAGSAGDWKRFLGCWRDRFAALPDGAGRDSALRGQVRPDGAAAAAVMAEMDAAEKRLGVKLPSSYRDFVLAFAAAPRPAGKSLENDTGLLPPSQIGFVRDLSPLSAQLAADYPTESDDAEYLVYGVGQDDAAMRSSYVPQGILIGKYGRNASDEIVLYPRLRTTDGEMEAALGYHAGQFRAPSFAELMRQLSHLELAAPDAVPPYKQGKLRGSCADRLPMRDVWWL